jgi:hypothetical protein
MLRVIAIAVFAYVGYRIIKEYVGPVPQDFEPVGLLPPPPLHIEAPRKRKRSALSGRPQPDERIQPPAPPCQITRVSASGMRP